MGTLQIKLEDFEGPFDLLFKLINKNKINIYDIPIAVLTDQYFQQIRQLENRNMEELSEFILMSATLLEIKSKMLLPKYVDDKLNEEDPREDLVMKLIEYKNFKKIAELFREYENSVGQSVYRNKDKYIMETIKQDNVIKVDEILQDVNLNILYNAFKEVIKRKELKIDKIRSKFKSVTRAQYNINDKMKYIANLIILYNKITFDKIFEESNSKSEIIVTFLAMLELVKDKTIFVVQDGIFGDIIITKGDNL